jgi:predicted transcriptional regulator
MSAKTASKTDLDERVRAAIEESEQTYRNEQDEPADVAPTTGGVRRNQARSTVYSIRLNPEEVARLEAVAAARDVRSSALVRGWILAALTEHESAQQSPARVLGEIERAVASLREVLGPDALAKGN